MWTRVRICEWSQGLEGDVFLGLPASDVVRQGAAGGPRPLPVSFIDVPLDPAQATQEQLVEFSGEGGAGFLLSRHGWGGRGRDFMSFGEPTKTPDKGLIIRYFSELVDKHGVIFCASAGNSGPALSMCKAGLIDVPAERTGPPSSRAKRIPMSTLPRR